MKLDEMRLLDICVVMGILVNVDVSLECQSVNQSINSSISTVSRKVDSSAY